MRSPPKISPTRHGLRLSQHGVVISELRTHPGPTHSVFDVLAALVAVIRPRSRMGILGFAGGGMMAPLRALGIKSRVDSVDLDRTGYDLFRRHCAAWAGRLRWRQDDALAWLRRQAPDFGLLMDDLSVPAEGDVVKPAISWDVLPRLIRGRLRRDGIAIFNLLPPAPGGWPSSLQRVANRFPAAHVICLDDFGNRLVVAGARLPTVRALGFRLRESLRRLESRQAGRIHVRSLR